MNKYILQDDASNDTVEVKYQVRLNAWGKVPNSIDILKTTKKIHTPWAHTKYQVDIYLNNKDDFLNKCHHFAKNVLAFKKNDKVIVEGQQQGLVVEITSDIQCGIMDELLIVRKDRTCNHTYTVQNHQFGDFKGCDLCHKSIVSVILSNNVKEIQNALKNGYVLEPFYSPYFNVSIIGEVDYNSMRKSVAGQGSFNNLRKNRYFKVITNTNPFDDFV